MAGFLGPLKLRAIRLIMISAILATAPLAGQGVRDTAGAHPWSVVGIVSNSSDPDTLIFRNGRRSSPDLWGVEVRASLATSNVPFLVLSGVGCGECDGDRMIFVQSAIYSPVPWEKRVWEYEPGTTYSTEPDGGVTVVRVFIGHCLVNMEEGVAWFVSLKDSTGVSDRVHVVDVVSDSLRIREFSAPLPHISNVAAFVRTRSCRELASSR